MTRGKRSTPKQKITWLSKHPQLFSDFRDDPHNAQVRVFNALKCAKLIAPTTAMVDTDTWGYIIEADKCAKIRHDKQMAPH